MVLALDHSEPSFFSFSYQNRFARLVSWAPTTRSFLPSPVRSARVRPRGPLLGSLSMTLSFHWSPPSNQEMALSDHVAPEELQVKEPDPMAAATSVVVRGAVTSNWQLSWL